MIIGAGTDIVEIARIEKLLSEKFIEKIFNEEERISIDDPKAPSHYAKRFAAKEAIAKALGTGIGKLNFRHITVTNLESGQPVAKVKDTKYKIHLSMSDEKTYAIAFAVVEK